MHTLYMVDLREAAVRTGDDVFPSDGFGVPHDAISDDLRMLHGHDVMGDDAGDQDLSVRQLHLLPYPPLVLMTRIGRLERISTGADLEYELDDLLQRRIRGV